LNRFIARFGERFVDLLPHIEQAEEGFLRLMVLCELRLERLTFILI
jgi:hypothetical protein